MNAVDEAIIHLTVNAPWLPDGGRAEVIRCATAPRPMCVVRLLLRRDDEVFCVPRSATGRLDLPMLVVEPGDLDGSSAIRLLADRIVGPGSEARFVGAVRNVVDSSAHGYDWPTPRAHFGVWVSDDVPVSDGTWVSLRGRAWPAP